MNRVAHIWRNPIKSHGVEVLNSVELSAGKCLPWDRHWAVAHENSDADGSSWVPCVNFSRGSKAPLLMAIKAQLDEASGRVRLSHPACEPLVFDPEREAQALIDWAAPLMPEGRARSSRVIRVKGRGMTDTDYASVSVCNLASNRAVGAELGHEISPLRWRGNIWLDGLAPFEEFDWVGHRLRIGEAELEIRERITRCAATTANPETGRRDADTLGALKSGWGHQEFGVYAYVTRPGRVALDDEAELL
ncbi:MAG: MOSC domain-containing protein [Halocynthiibacter sp.]